MPNGFQSVDRGNRGVLVAFLRGANVGGHRRFRPALVANELAQFDVVNVGATGLFVARGRVSATRFRRELLKRLPFETHIAICDASDVLALEESDPFPEASLAADVVPFVSVLCEPSQCTPAMPISIPKTGEWYVRITGRQGPFAFGVYRKHMKTISYLGKIDAALGVAATTRTWNTFGTVLRIIRAHGITRKPQA